MNKRECEDAISRQAAIDAILKIHPADTEYDCTLYDKIDIMYVLKDLPPVNPQESKTGHWIPCSERLPKACRFVNCTCHSLIDNREDWVVETFYMPQPSGSPYSDWGNIPMLNDGKCEVIAWMYRNIPEPYRAGMEG